MDLERLLCFRGINFGKRGKKNEETVGDNVKNRLLNIKQKRISEDNVYQFLLYFDKLYDKFTDLEKKEFLNSFVEQVDIYEQEQPDGRFLKHIKFRFPVYFNGSEIEELSWDNESTVETEHIVPQIDHRIFDISLINDAMKLVAKGHTNGKVII